ncbi:MAG TPA: FG-GAP-like repeat-containing protein [Pyrinomonadaceae bacterium]|jgi:uncharacterized delta-60 repeat protein
MFLNDSSKLSRYHGQFGIFAFLMLLIFVFNFPALSAAGDLDPTFGGSGALKLSNLQIIGNILVQADGKILSSASASSGPSYLVRFTTNGGYDNGFGAGGFLRPQVGQNSASGIAFTLQSDGKIVVFASVPNTGNASEFYVIRYNSNGLPDSTFGTDGVVSVPSAASWVGFSKILVQPDGKMLICGLTPATSGSSFNRNYALLRLNPNGTPDASFGNNGIFVPDPALDLQFYPYATLLQADNKILISGTRIGSGGGGFYSARFLANGAVDTSYGTNGKVVTTFGTFSTPYDAALQSDGKLVQGGTLLGSAPAPDKITLVRYTPDGQLDSSFGTNGISLTTLNNRSLDAFGMTIHPNGKILVCGYGHNSTPDFSGGALVARFNQSGALDTTFGRGKGFVLTQYPQPSDTAQYFDIAVQPTGGKVVAAGFSRYDKYLYSAIIARYLNNDVPDFDFDGDGKADVSIFRPNSAAEWYWQNSSTGQSSGVQFGVDSDKPVAADYDGDGKSDVAVFRNGDWYRLNSSNNQFVAVHFGQNGDVPVPADYDGDTKADLAVYRQGWWYILNSAGDSFRADQFGISTDKPIIGDFDGDGKSDLAVYRDGVWYQARSAQGFYGEQFGIAPDRPVPADYDGDGKTDLAVYRPSDGTWYLLGSSNGFTALQFGIETDKPVPADYDGDGKTDIAVYRDGYWYLQQSTAGFQTVQYGAAGDTPVPSAFVP